MFCLVEVDQSPRMGNAIQEVRAHGPFATRGEAVVYYFGELPSLLKDTLEADKHEIIINNTLVQVVELIHPTQ